MELEECVVYKSIFLNRLSKVYYGFYILLEVADRVQVVYYFRVTKDSRIWGVFVGTKECLYDGVHSL